MSWCAGFGGSFYSSYFEVRWTETLVSVVYLVKPIWRLERSSSSQNLSNISDFGHGNIPHAGSFLAQVMPKQQGFEKRRDLYMLYHYLNHYNLFGSGYRSSAMSIIDDYLKILKAWCLRMNSCSCGQCSPFHNKYIAHGRDFISRIFAWATEEAQWSPRVSCYVKEDGDLAFWSWVQEGDALLKSSSTKQ